MVTKWLALVADASPGSDRLTPIAAPTRLVIQRATDAWWQHCEKPAAFPLSQPSTFLLHSLCVCVCGFVCVRVASVWLATNQSEASTVEYGGERGWERDAKQSPHCHPSLLSSPLSLSIFYAVGATGLYLLYHLLNIRQRGVGFT